MGGGGNTVSTAGTPSVFAPRLRHSNFLGGAGLACGCRDSDKQDVLASSPRMMTPWREVLGSQSAGVLSESRTVGVLSETKEMHPEVQQVLELAGHTATPRLTPIVWTFYPTRDFFAPLLGTWADIQKSHSRSQNAGLR
mmetsp:Transcript_17291/g.40687  ORF Transcript_17291/g.40687 Transcript_17291/m.40687 type:complete len:139 (-) Transcript_17291:15-431(-)